MSFGEIFKVFKKTPLPSDEVLDKIPSFMFCRFLEGSPYTILAGNRINMFHKEIPMHLQYKIIRQAFGGKNIFPVMPKKSAENKDLDALCHHFKISRDKAVEYSQFLTEHDINKIKETYKGIS